jgi:hypothetical protein
MTKKALIVGISNYGGRVVGLESPDREIQEWRDLLVETYGFPYQNVRLLANERALKTEIERRLHWLFDGAQARDQLVFVYCGHGVRLPERNEDSGELIDHLDEALLTYPLPADDLAKVAYYDKDFFALLGSKGLPAGADVTLILDCCFGGGFNLSDLPRRPAPMTIDLPIDLQHRNYRRKTQPSTYWSDTAVPVLVSAAGELNLAVEMDLDGAKRSLFSYHAIKTLRQKPKITFAEFKTVMRDEIEKVYPQYPNVKGNRSRLSHPFLT